MKEYYKDFEITYSEKDEVWTVDNPKIGRIVESQLKRVKYRIDGHLAKRKVPVILRPDESTYKDHIHKGDVLRKDYDDFVFESRKNGLTFNLHQHCLLKDTLKNEVLASRIIEHYQKIKWHHDEIFNLNNKLIYFDPDDLLENSEETKNGSR